MLALFLPFFLKGAFLHLLPFSQLALLLLLELLFVRRVRVLHRLRGGYGWFRCPRIVLLLFCEREFSLLVQELFVQCLMRVHRRENCLTFLFDWPLPKRGWGQECIDRSVVNSIEYSGYASSRHTELEVSVEGCLKTCG